MPDPDPTPHKSPGDLDARILADIDLATDCHTEAAETDVAAALSPRDWTAADQTALGASLARCAAFKAEIKAARTGKKTRTDEEEAARTALENALNPIIIAARGKYPKGAAERRAYGHGVNIDAASTRALLDLADYGYRQLGPGEGGTPPKDTLPGLLPAEITALHTLHTQYSGADWAQGEAQELAETLLQQLRAERTDTLNVLRHKLQNRAELAYPHTNPANAALRKRFGLPPDKRAID